MKRFHYFKTPFPWFGGKSRVAPIVWSRFGNIRNYVEPFFGSGAVLFRRPMPFEGVEKVNDLDGFVANFWRSIKLSPEETAKWARNPVFENDLHARHKWLVEQRKDFTLRLESDPEFHDPKIAGWWVWGVSCWIGGGFCSDKDSHLTRGVPFLSWVGNGVNQGNLTEQQVRKWFFYLSFRLRTVRVCSGDWKRICGSGSLNHMGLAGVFLDPPYSSEANRDDKLYAKDDLNVAHEVREWALENGERRDLRIALCGYVDEHAKKMPESWELFRWKAGGGYTGIGNAKGKENRFKEAIWFSPSCRRPVKVSTSKRIAAKVAPRVDAP